MGFFCGWLKSPWSHNVYCLFPVTGVKNASVTAASAGQRPATVCITSSKVTLLPQEKSI